MANSFFFLGELPNQQSSYVVKSLKKYSSLNKVQVYILKRPLGENKYSYSYEGGLIVLVPNHKIMVLNTGDSEEEFEDFYEDFVEDLAAMSDKYNYIDVVGRVRVWRKEVLYKSSAKVEDSNFSVRDLLSENSLNSAVLQKKTELLISLLTGSINDIERVKKDVPNNLLDKIKQKILLFDGDQTRFVYGKPSNKKVTIQGLSGTGKTELLLHKLKEIYLGQPDSRIMFTCHNKILAANLRDRIPSFFNFMKVQEQIEWNQRLWCVHAWGSRVSPDSGAYRYICNKYGIPFKPFSYSYTFSDICKEAEALITDKVLSEKGHAFNYILIDESQDFPPEFISLCERVTENTVYVAGDIFQSIFDENVAESVTPDYLLSKCYRTDPRTLMFAHGVGMGLFEKHKLRWLSDDEWARCGYLIEKEDKLYRLKREPLRRFEDLAENKTESMKIVRAKPNEFALNVVSVIRGIMSENPTVTLEDIGIIFLGGKNWGYQIADVLEILMPKEFGWEVNKAYDSKEKVEGKLFVSNKNNVKGLEFPFVICLSDIISNAKHERNALYMTLTRSFIQSYLIVNEQYNIESIKAVENGLACINTLGYMEVFEPEDKDQLRTTIDYDGSNQSAYEILESIFDELDVPPIFKDPIYGLVKTLNSEKIDYVNLKELVVANLEKMKILQ